MSYIFKKIYLFIEEKESKRARWKGQREREAEKQTPLLAQSLMQGSISGPWDHDLSQNQELDAYPSKPPRHPDTVK